ncbi:hypothetical protein SAMN05518865_10836 [Duganella sp. CF458]|nr:hypothetical protein SAMN05518865_10836 [Duganella sp. CF458]
MVDILVSSCQRFFVEFRRKARWRFVAKARVAPLTVVENLDVFRDCRLRFSPAGILEA